MDKAESNSLSNLENFSHFASSVLCSSGLSDKDESSQHLLFRREILPCDSGASKVTSPTSAQSRFSALTSLSSEGRNLTPLGNAGSSSDSFASTTMPLKPSRSPNWSDAETRFLITLWGEQYENISQQRNAKAWDIVARLLNQKLAQCGFETFRTGQQCKGRMKSIVFDYRTAKKRISESGEVERTCDYFDDIDVILGKAQGGSSSEIPEPSTVVTPDSDRALEISDENEDSNVSDDIVVVNIPTSSALNIDTTTGLGVTRVEANQAITEDKESFQRKEPPRKRKKKASEDEEDVSTLRFLKGYLEESDRRDREFLLQMTQMDREREERNYERTMKFMMEMAKAFKTSTACTHDHSRVSNVSAAPHTPCGDVRFGSGVNRNDKSVVSARVGENNGTQSHKDFRQGANEGGGSRDKKGGQSLQFLKDYMEESDRKDREFLLQMTRMDREREERNSEQTIRLMMEVAKVFGGGS